MKLPSEIASLRSWLVWRLRPREGKKPLKIPFYLSGPAREAQGTRDDVSRLVSLDDALAAVGQREITGVGLAMLGANGLVALDFDGVVDSATGAVRPDVLALVAGTYAEYSPSGTGVRAFFTGAIRDRKSISSAGRSVGAFDVEFFHSAGYVTVTGRVLSECAMWGWAGTVAPLSESVRALYAQRFGDVGAVLGGGSAGASAALSGSDSAADFFGDASGSWLLALSSKVGLSIEKARDLTLALDHDCSYSEWLTCGQSLHHEFDGADAALGIWREWSKQYVGEGGYVGDDALRAKWKSFGDYRGAPITGAWLLKHAKTAKVVARYEALQHWTLVVASGSDADSDKGLREVVCPAIAKDARLGDVEREALAQQLLTRFASLNVKLPIGMVRKLVATPDSRVPTVRLKRPLTEFGNAERMLDRYGAGLMYVPEVADWYTWNGVHWKKAAGDVAVEHLAKETIRGLISEAEDHEGSAEFYQWCALSQQSKMVRAMVALASSDPRVVVPASELDRDVDYLGVANGMIHLPTGKFMAPDPLKRITLVTGCGYKHDAKCPLFEQTLRDIFQDDPELPAFLRRALAYALTGKPINDLMFIPFGDGSNGKSTVLNVVRKVFGAYARTAEASTFVSDSKNGPSAGGPREDLLRLRGARFVYVNEPEENTELRESVVKSMTGGEDISARGLFSKATVEITPTWVVFMPTNHKPIIKGTDRGIWRRLVLLPFLRNFEADPTIVKDEAREEKLDAEREGILSWLLGGISDYISWGLATPESVKKARESYRTQMDVLADWLSESCEVHLAYSERPSSLWASWESYAKVNGLQRHIQSSVSLGRRLDARFPSSKDAQGNRVRTGIRLKRGDDDFFS